MRVGTETRYRRVLRLVAVGLGARSRGPGGPGLGGQEHRRSRWSRSTGPTGSTSARTWCGSSRSGPMPARVRRWSRDRGDALQLVGMNSRTGAATAIGIPRDSWVDIPGYGSNKINAALYFGGPQADGRGRRQPGRHPARLRRDLRASRSSRRWSRRSAGSRVDNPVAFSDEFLKPKGFDPGSHPPQRVRRDGVLAASGTTWSSGDFDRSANQQRVLRGIQAKVRAKADRPGFMERGVMTVMQHLHTDLSPTELYRLAQVVSHVDPAKITTCVVQGSIGEVGGASVVLPFVDQARGLRRRRAPGRDDQVLLIRPPRPGSDGRRRPRTARQGRSRRAGRSRSSRACRASCSVPGEDRGARP